MNNCKSKCQCMDCVLLPELQLEEVKPDKLDELVKRYRELEKKLDESINRINRIKERKRLKNMP